MTEPLVLLPGWGFAPSILEPLAQALHQQQPNLNIILAPLPRLSSADPEAWLSALEEQLPRRSWLAGWSLGGMLATALAARRGNDCLGLFTFASNPCFVARSNWPQAMPAETFAAFYQGCEHDPNATQKRFALLCAQGCPEARSLSRGLSAHYQTASDTQQLAGLAVLATLDNRPALQGFQGPQQHLLAAQDALVPASAAQALAELLPNSAAVRVLDNTGHAALVSEPQRLAEALLDWMQARP